MSTVSGPKVMSKLPPNPKTYAQIKAKRKCIHNWVRVFNIHSWRYKCSKCGGCCR